MPPLSFYLLLATFLFIAQSEQLPSTPPCLSDTCVKPRTVLGTQDRVRKTCHLPFSVSRNEQDLLQIGSGGLQNLYEQIFRFWCQVIQTLEFPLMFALSGKKKKKVLKKKKRKDIPVVWSLTNELGLKLGVSAVDRVWNGKSGGLGSQLGTLQSLLFLEPWLPHSLASSESEELPGGSSSSSSLWF